MKRWEIDFGCGRPKHRLGVRLLLNGRGKREGCGKFFQREGETTTKNAERNARGKSQSRCIMRRKGEDIHRGRETEEGQAFRDAEREGDPYVGRSCVDMDCGVAVSLQLQPHGHVFRPVHVQHPQRDRKDTHIYRETDE